MKSKFSSILFIWLSVFVLQSCITSEQDGYFGINIEEDTEAPIIKILVPEAGEVLKGTEIIIFNVEDLTGLEQVEFIVTANNKVKSKEKILTSVTPSFIEWDTHSLNGNFDIQIIGTDPFGNVGESETVTITIDNPQVKTVYTNENSELIGNSVLNLDFDSKGVSYLATSNGLQIFDNETWSVVDNNNSEMSTPLVRTVFVDDEDVVWIGSNDGLFQYKNGITTRITGTSDQDFRNPVTKIIKDIDETLWIGTTYAGIYRYKNGSLDRIGGGLENDFPCHNCIEGKVPSNGTSVNDISLNMNGYPIVAFRYGLYEYDGNEWIELDDTKQFYSVDIEDDGTIWASSNFGKDYNLFSNGVQQVISYEDLQARNFLFMEDNTMLFWDYGKLTTYDGTTFTEYDETNSTFSKAINSIYYHSGNTIWMSTREGLYLIEI